MALRVRSAATARWTNGLVTDILSSSPKRTAAASTGLRWRLESASPCWKATKQMDRLQIGPDGRWMTFNVRGHVYLAPVDPEIASAKDQWTSIVSFTGAGRTAGLSPDGSLLYLLLETDGFRCLYGLRLDPKTGQPRETPFLIAHFHDAARSWGGTGLGSAAVKGLFVADLFETTSNIWVASFGGSDR